MSLSGAQPSGWMVISGNPFQQMILIMVIIMVMILVYSVPGPQSFWLEKSVGESRPREQPGHYCDPCGGLPGTPRYRHMG